MPTAATTGAFVAEGLGRAFQCVAASPRRCRPRASISASATCSRSSRDSSDRRSQNGRSHWRASSAHAVARRAARRVPPPGGRAGRRRRTGPTGAAVAARRACFPASRPPGTAAGVCATSGENAWWLASRRAVCRASSGWRAMRVACSFRRRAWVRRARPGAALPASPARVVRRGLPAPIRQPASAPRRRHRAALALPSAPAQRLVARRSCRRCRLPAASNCASMRNFDVALQLPNPPGCSGALRGLARTAVAGAKVLGQGLAQGSLRRALAAQCAPLAARLGSVSSELMALRRRHDQQAAQHQQHEEVQRQVGAPAAQ
jgi:hypothetical protein